MTEISQTENILSSQSRPARNPSGGPAFLFDFDGTLLDSVYQHVLAWHEALLKAGIELSVWRIHRRIGMSGGLLVNALSRETGRHLIDEEARQLQHWHAEAYLNQINQVRPLPGARDLLAYLTTSGTPWAIATSGRMQTAGPNLAVLGIGSDVRIITRDQGSDDFAASGMPEVGLIPFVRNALQVSAARRFRSSARSYINCP